MNISEFLEARITEDEVSATLRECHREDCGWIPDASGYSYPCECGVPERMAAECAAKRAIIKLADDAEGLDYRVTSEWGGEIDGTGEDILKALAAVYADHSDYQQGWAT